MTLSIASNRKFGVEIECTRMTCGRAVEILENAGISVNRSSSGYYNHRDDARRWKVVTDGSVSGGCEVVSPILSGIAGLEQVKKVAEALNAAGATANRSCGLHVHVDARGLSGAAVAAVVNRYAKHERTIDTYMPHSRRNGNSYCKTMSEVARRFEVFNFRPPTSVNDVVYAFGSDRFRKLNLVSYNSHGTIEFRHHSGTVQASKIIPWIQFCVNFVEQSAQSVAGDSSPAPSRGRNTGRARSSKQLVALHKIVNLLAARGQRGVTATELSDATGLSESSCIVYVSKLRTTYRFRIAKRRVGYVLVSEGRLPELEVAIGARPSTNVRRTRRVASIDDSTPLVGLPPSVVSYFQERASDLAS